MTTQYRLYARHSDGQKSVWDGEFENFTSACMEVSSAIKAETGAVPLAILTLVTPTFKVDNEH